MRNTKFYVTAYEGNSGGGGDPPKDTPKTFTQKEVDEIVGRERINLRKKNEELVGQLEELKKNVSLSEDEKLALNTRIDELRANYETESDKLKRESKAKEENFNTQVKTLTTERDTWKTRYSQATIARAITDAAVAHNAISAEDMTILLKDNTRLVEVVDDEGKPTGSFEVKTEFRDKTDKGEEKVFLLTPGEAVERMKKNTSRYGHYFKNDQAGGTGGAVGGSGKKKQYSGADIATMTDVEYQAYRKEQGINK